MEASALSPPAGLGRRSGTAPLLRLRSDEQLVALFREGHDDAFRVIHDRYRQRLFSYTRQMLSGSRSDAEDALQDVFLRAYHALRADDRPVTLRAWLYRVAHNRCVDQLRRPVPVPADVFALNRAPLHDPLAEAERREDLRRLVRDIRALPEQQRSALLMREMEGLTYAELGDALDVSIPAIKSLLVRARIGLVESIEARDTACGDIRTDLTEAHDRGVRASGRSRRHLRECAGCREYRTALRGVDRALNGLAPGAGPLATLAKLLGLGGAGSGAAAGGSAAAGGGAAVVGGGAAAATATKIVAVVCCAAVVGGGAAEVGTQVKQRAAASSAPPAVVPVQRVVAPLARTAVAVMHAAPAVAAQQAHRRRAAERSSSATDTLPADALDGGLTGSGTAAPTVLEVTTGGLQAPDEPATDVADPSTSADGTGLATEPASGALPDASTPGGLGGDVAAGKGSGPATSTSGTSTSTSTATSSSGTSSPGSTSSSSSSASSSGPSASSSAASAGGTSGAAAGGSPPVAQGASAEASAAG